MWCAMWMVAVHGGRAAMRKWIQTVGMQRTAHSHGRVRPLNTHSLNRGERRASVRASRTATRLGNLADARDEGIGASIHASTLGSIPSRRSSARAMRGGISGANATRGCAV